MEEEIKKQKNEVRALVLAKCKSLNLHTLVKRAVHLLSEEDIFVGAHTVLAYKPFGHEIPFVDELMRQFPNKKYYYPQTRGKHMYFINLQGELLRKEPRKAVIIVPAVAVDKKGNRLGRGRGCYDRFLSNLEAELLSVSVVPECSVVDNLPTEPHDITINKIIICKR